MNRLPPTAPALPETTGRAALLPSLLACLLAACGGVSGPSDLQSPSVACASQPVTQLAVGAHLILDPAASSGCLRVPAASAGGAQYLLVLASTNGSKSSAGISGSYLLRSSNPMVALRASAPAGAPAAGASVGRMSGQLGAEFEATLRRREQELAADPSNRPNLLTAAPALAPVAPPVGHVKSFKVCSNLACTTFSSVQATARFVGEHAAVYLDNEVPQADPLQDSDLANLGTSFDVYHYPIDTTAFGRESDIDANGVVIVLMTDAVNDLTPDCHNGRVIGYFFGGDLLTGPNSNRGEIFYTLVPKPATPDCSVVTRKGAVNNLKPTLIHEFQHMISFYQHVLLRNGSSEEVWLNEALSHFAEELGGRLVPDGECIAAGFVSCRQQYASGDIGNSYDYLRDTESSYMVFPSASQGTLTERGAGWFFLRWSLDQFSADTILGTPTTRALDATALTGMANLTAVTGGSFATMVPQWLLAAYLDDGPDLPVEPTGRLRFKSWGLRAIWTDPANASVFKSGFPLAPQTLSGVFSLAGTLRAGSGRHFLLTQSPTGAAIDVQVLKSSTGAQLDATLQARFGIVRIR